MIIKRWLTKNSFTFLMGLSGIVAVSGIQCTLTATRPVQEMSNANAALRAAKGLHADSLTPELYRAATENYYKAKRNYREKKFEFARKFAIRAMHLAEKAEFQSYILGGATPEVADTAFSPEGASADPEDTFGRPQPKPGEPNLNEELKADKEDDDEKEASLEESPLDKGLDYNAYLEQEAQRKAAEAAEAQKRAEQESTKPKRAQTPPPNGMTGPSNLAQFNNSKASLPHAHQMPTVKQITPNTASKPQNINPAANPVPQSNTTPAKKTDDKTSNDPSLINQQLYTGESTPSGGPIPNFNAQDIPSQNAQNIPSLDENAAEFHEGFKDLSNEENPYEDETSLNSLSPAYDSQSKKEKQK